MALAGDATDSMRESAEAGFNESSATMIFSRSSLCSKGLMTGNLNVLIFFGFTTKNDTIYRIIDKSLGHNDGTNVLGQSGR